jgi:hypothetical protein
VKAKLLLAALLNLTILLQSVQATDSDYSQAAGHTGIYINKPNVSALKCKIQTYDLTAKNNKLGWYTAWPMIVDYKSGKFVQIGYITSPAEKITKPTFFVAWSNEGKQINLKYLPDKGAAGNALQQGSEHEYALSLNIDGSVNIQIDGVKYLDAPTEKIKIGIKEGTGEFFSEGSNVNIDISTRFFNCFYKLRGDTKWRELEQDKKLLLYHAADGTEIESLVPGSFLVKGKIKKEKRGRFFKDVVNLVKIRKPEKGFE